jgi:hypothetical protein
MFLLRGWPAFQQMTCAISEWRCVATKSWSINLRGTCRYCGRTNSSGADTGVINRSTATEEKYISKQARDFANFHDYPYEPVKIYGSKRSGRF